VARKILAALLVLGPLTILADYLGAGDITLFVLAALALIPLAWLIGEATEHAAHHTGPGIGGFLNATFGNAPELIIALLAVNDGLFDVVRGSLTGSVVGNLLLVLGFSLAFGGTGRLDRASSLVSLGLVGLATLLFLIPSIAGFDGDPQGADLWNLSWSVAIVLLLVYISVTVLALRRHRQLHVSDEPAGMQAWSMTRSMVALAAATVVTALVAEVLVGSLEVFAHQVGLSAFFVSAVIVAIVGNAAEHGGAIVVAAKGNIRLASEIALASSAQVAVFLIPAVTLLSWFIDPLNLSFRPIEIATLGGSVVVTALVIWGGRSSRTRGLILIAAYVVAAIGLFIAGDR
jgi:Ca2+:H+ antiporter